MFSFSPIKQRTNKIGILIYNLKKENALNTHVSKRFLNNKNKLNGKYGFLLLSEDPSPKIISHSCLNDYFIKYCPPFQRPFYKLAKLLKINYVPGRLSSEIKILIANDQASDIMDKTIKCLESDSVFASNFSEKVKFYTFFPLINSNDINKSVIEKIKEDSIENLVILSMKPHYYCKDFNIHFRDLIESLNTYKDQQKSSQKIFNCTLINRYGLNQKYITALQNNIYDMLSVLKNLSQEQMFIIFSHLSPSLNEVYDGDVILDQVYATVDAVMRDFQFDIPYSLAWFNKLRDEDRLMTPDIISTVDNNLNFHKKSYFILVPLDQPTDGFYTRRDYDILLPSFIEKNISGYNIFRVTNISSKPKVMSSIISDIFINHLKTQNTDYNVNCNLFSTCPFCNNKYCREFKSKIKLLCN